MNAFRNCVAKGLAAVLGFGLLQSAAFDADAGGTDAKSNPVRTVRRAGEKPMEYLVAQGGAGAANGGADRSIIAVLKAGDKGGATGGADRSIIAVLRKAGKDQQDLTCRKAGKDQQDFAKPANTGKGKGHK